MSATDRIQAAITDLQMVAEKLRSERCKDVQPHADSKETLGDLADDYVDSAISALRDAREVIWSLS